MDLTTYDLTPIQIVYVIAFACGLFLGAWIAVSLLGGGPRE